MIVGRASLCLADTKYSSLLLSEVAETLADATGLIPGEGTIASAIKITGTVASIGISASGSLSDAAAGGVFTGVGLYAETGKQELLHVAPTLGKDVAEAFPD